MIPICSTSFWPFTLSCREVFHSHRVSICKTTPWVLVKAIEHFSVWRTYCCKWYLSQPDHGSLLQYGGLFRYTPYKGFNGNDSFVYTICDVNGNVASGSVNIDILSIPPQFVSFPSQLHGTEDLISPRFGYVAFLYSRFSFEKMKNTS